MTDTEILDALSDLLTTNEGNPLLLVIRDTGPLGLTGELKISDVKSNAVSEQPTLREVLKALLV